MKVIYNNKEVANTTLNYNELFNKPLLNSHELVGNTSLNDIGVYSKPQVDNLIASTRSIKVVSALPTPLVANTMYYVGPDQNNLYHIYLVDSSLTLIDLGMSQDAVYLGGNGIDISSDNEISVVFDNETLMLNSEGELYVRPATENVEGVVSYDNTTIKKNNYGKIYVNNSDTIVGTTDADKIGMTKGAVQKYTDTLVGGGSGATNIPANADLNTIDYTIVGSYLCNNNTNVVTLSNCPTTIAFKMVVENVVHSNTGSLNEGSGYTSRVCTIKDYAGNVWRRWIERSGTGTISYGAWKRVLEANSATDVGSFVKPVYIHNGVITPVNQAASGAYTGFVPYVSGGAGVIEVGQFIDFHAPTSTKDFDVRLAGDDVSGDLKVGNSVDQTRGGTIYTSGNTNRIWINGYHTDIARATTLKTIKSDGFFPNGDVNVGVPGNAGLSITSSNNIFDDIKIVKIHSHYKLASTINSRTMWLSAISSSILPTLSLTGINNGSIYTFNNSPSSVSGTWVSFPNALPAYAATDNFFIDLEYHKVGTDSSLPIWSIKGKISGGVYTAPFSIDFFIDGKGSTRTNLPSVEFWGNVPTIAYLSYTIELCKA